ncbi:MAG: aldo/keto reductase [Paenibacillus sp.]|nr:aldo/keto reductase [Paenibacillus sp.]
MKYETIPNTDLSASSICYGTAPIGSTLDEAASFRMLDLFVELGGNFMDSSHNYANWACDIPSISEKTIGKWMKQRNNRNRMIVSTKGACPDSKGRFFRLQPEDIMADLDDSLINMQTDCIDLYWLHRDDPSVEAEIILDTLLDAVDAGKIRYFACSNWTLSRLEEVQKLAEQKGRQGFCASQIQWSLAQPNKELMSDKTIVVMKASVARLYFSDANFGRLERASEVAAQLGTTTNVIALAYLHSHPFAVFPIVGSHREEQMIDSCKAGDLRLDEATARYINSGV